MIPPPILAPLPAPQPRSGGLAWKIVAIVALVLLAFSMLSHLTHFSHGLVPRSSSMAYERDRKLEEIFIERKNTDSKIAVVELSGVITESDTDRSGMNMVEFIDEQLKLAAKDNDVKAVILKVNSPGGEVLAADEINRSITKFEKDTGRPVVASMGSLAASGGYYVSAPCRWIVANELTITGSIGVIMHGYNYRGLMDKVGIKPQVFKSGKFKDMLSGDQEPDEDKLSPEDRDIRIQERKMVQDLINETFGKFKEVVATGRKAANKENGTSGRNLVEDWKDYADGRVFSGKQAFDLGFVDELGNFEVAVKRAKDLAKISNASLIQYRQPFNLGSLFGLLGKTETPAIKVDLGLNQTKLQSGHLYYITPTVLN